MNKKTKLTSPNRTASSTQALNHTDPDTPQADQNTPESHHAGTEAKPNNNQEQTQQNKHVLQPEDKLSDDKDYLAIGKIGRSHGLHGMVFVQSYADPKENLFHYPSLKLGNGQPIAFSHHQKHAKQIIAQVAEHTSCDTVKPLANQIIYVLTKHLPSLPEGEYYWHQLVGCKVVNQDGFVYGKVDYVYEGAQFPILVIKHPEDHRKPDILIPYEPSTIQRVAMTEQIITVDWITDL